jgi:hypothetical protein
VSGSVCCSFIVLRFPWLWASARMCIRMCIWTANGHARFSMAVWFSEVRSLRLQQLDFRLVVAEPATEGRRTWRCKMRRWERWV